MGGGSGGQNFGYGCFKAYKERLKPFGIRRGRGGVELICRISYCW